MPEISEISSPEAPLLSSEAFDLSNHTVLRFTGKDRLRYLNGQVTQDLRKLTPEVAMPACVVNAKGRLQAVVWIAEFGDALWVESDPELAETLVARFDRYIVADDVVLEDVTGQMGLFHVVGFDPTKLFEDKGVTVLKVSRLGQLGWDVWVPADRRGVVESVLGEWIRNPERWEQLRVAQGIPKWGTELGEETLPPEAGLERTHIDYHKGCYIGQEVISRLKSVGHVNRNLVRLYAASGVDVMGGGVELFVAGNVELGGVGKVTSVVTAESGRVDVLAYVKRGVTADEFELATGGRLRRY